MFGGTGISLADIAAVTRGNGDGDGFGGNNGWWILIILFALFGWGGNGYGNNGNRQADAALGAEVQRGFDTQSVIQKLDGLNSGLCSLGYDQLSQMNGIRSDISQANFNLQNTIQGVASALNNSIQNQAITQMQDFNALSRQLGDCCCENRQAIAQLNYNMATQACETRQVVQNLGRDIIENQNNNYRALHEENVQAQMQAKDSQITALQLALQQANFAASQTAQTCEIVRQLTPPVAQPAYMVPNPNCCYGPWGGYATSLQNDSSSRCCGC